MLVSNEDGLVGCKRVSWETTIAINTPIKVREGHEIKSYETELNRMFRIFIDKTLWFEDPDFEDEITL